MDIVFCYYNDINRDARAQEELAALCMMGKIHFVSYIKYNNDLTDNVDYRIIEKRDLRLFLRHSKKVIKEIRPELVFLHDYFCAPLIEYAGKKCGAETVYDMSELYIGKEVPDAPLVLKVKRALLRHWEYRYLPMADVTVAANTQRAFIAKGYFRLKEQPIVFDNIHKITDEIDEQHCKAKYDALLGDDAFKILFAGGIFYPNERDAEYVLDMMNDLGAHYRLIAAGTKSDVNSLFDRAMEKNRSVGNIHYIGVVPRSELRYLFKNVDVNIVTFSLTSINNIFCASGKLYEGLFEGLPFICSENPPMSELCDRYHIGVTAKNHNYSDAVKEIESRLQYYRENVGRYISALDYDSRIERLKCAVEERIK